MGLLELAGYVDALPPGCALWRATGGPRSWTPEVRVLHEIEYRLRVLAWQNTKDGADGRNQPKPTEPPRYAGQQRAEEVHANRQAEARRRREAKRAGGG